MLWVSTPRKSPETSLQIPWSSGFRSVRTQPQSLSSHHLEIFSWNPHQTVTRIWEALLKMSQPQLFLSLRWPKMARKQPVLQKLNLQSQSNLQRELEAQWKPNPRRSRWRMKQQSWMRSKWVKVPKSLYEPIWNIPEENQSYVTISALKCSYYILVVNLGMGQFYHLLLDMCESCGKMLLNLLLKESVVVTQQNDMHVLWVFFWESRVYLPDVNLIECKVSGYGYFNFCFSLFVFLHFNDHCGMSSPHVTWYIIESAVWIPLYFSIFYSMYLHWPLLAHFHLDFEWLAVCGLDFQILIALALCPSHTKSSLQGSIQYPCVHSRALELAFNFNKSNSEIFMSPQLTLQL